MIFQMQVPAGQIVYAHREGRDHLHPAGRIAHQMKQNGMADSVLDAIRKARVVPPGNPELRRRAAQTLGDPDKAFAEAEVVSEGLYGVPVITHCCLEAMVPSPSGPTPIICLHTSPLRMCPECRADGGTAENSGQQHPRSPGPRRRRFWQQVFAGSLGNFYRADLQEGRRQTGRASCWSARPSSRSPGRGRPLTPA